MMDVKITKNTIQASAVKNSINVSVKKIALNLTVYKNQINVSMKKHYINVSMQWCTRTVYLVDTLANRDLIPVSVRYEGFICYVKENTNTYQLKWWILNTNRWPFGGWWWGTVETDDTIEWDWSSWDPLGVAWMTRDPTTKETKLLRDWVAFDDSLDLNDNDPNSFWITWAKLIRKWADDMAISWVWKLNWYVAWDYNDYFLWYWNSGQDTCYRAIYPWVNMFYISSSWWKITSFYSPNGKSYINFNPIITFKWFYREISSQTIMYISLAQRFTIWASTYNYARFWFDTGQNPTSPNEWDIRYNGTNLYFRKWSVSIDLLSSWHDIVDWTDSNLPKQPKLKFTSRFSVTDDIPNTRTVVDLNPDQVFDTLAFASEYDNWNSWASTTINWTEANNQKVTLTDNCIFSFTPIVSWVSRVQLKVIQDWTGGRNCFRPANVIRPNGYPTWTDWTPWQNCIITFYYDWVNYIAIATLYYSLPA